MGSFSSGLARFHREDGMGLERNEEGEPFSGIAEVAIGEIANFAAYAFAPAILVTPLGALSIIIRLFHPAGFLFFAAIIMTAVFVLVFHVIPEHGQTHVMAYIAVCSLVGSLTVMSVKALGIALKLTLSGMNQLIYPQTWAFTMILVSCVVMQMNYLNKMLMCFWLAVSNLANINFDNPLRLQDWDRQNSTQIVTEMCGFVTILSGTFLLHKTKDLSDENISLWLFPSVPNTPQQKGRKNCPATRPLNICMIASSGDFEFHPSLTPRPIPLSRQPPQSGHAFVAAIPPSMAIGGPPRSHLDAPLPQPSVSLFSASGDKSRTRSWPVKFGCLEWSSEGYLKSGGLWVSGSHRRPPLRWSSGEASGLCRSRGWVRRNFLSSSASFGGGFRSPANFLAAGILPQSFLFISSGADSLVLSFGAAVTLMHREKKKER
ncbi:hypothetical protein Cgig2_023750 [Carnegiea gigantea]|uniref:Probable magnesium transporter n=1 Tax=Carnegiea gigantea TaxID=171969 RepID=A0A9Q1QGS2_9CARY|nr:hypothetical protein Cgig2_023750 [Carnegiea gigantea]